MLGKQPGGGEGRIDTILGETCRFRGDLQVDGGVRIDGDFEGTMRATEIVIVGKTGSVRADINSEQVTVGGKVHGNIIGKRRVLLENGAHVEGDVTTTSLIISEGVYFQGGCRMGDGTGSSTAAAGLKAQWTGDSNDSRRGVPEEVKAGGVAVRGLSRSS
jgi:cytoskeletal protein CcmA (bactofilin family)